MRGGSAAPGRGGQARIGWFFAAAPGWAGEPANREPTKHSELVWVDPAAPTADLVAYTWADLAAWRAGEPWAVHWQQPGSPVHYDRARAAELTLLRPRE